MAGLVGDDVGGGEFACAALTAAKLGLDLAEEVGVEENLPVRRTIERSHRRLRHAATSAVGGVPEQHDTRADIGTAAFGENLAPAIVDLAENTGDHVAHLIGRRAALGLRRRPVGLVSWGPAGRRR